MGRITYIIKRYNEIRKHQCYTRNPYVWVFGEWFGNRVCDNSLYLANYVAQSHPDIQVYWVSKRGVDVSALCPRITCLEMDGPKTEDVLKDAAVVIMNQGLRDFSTDGTNYFAGAVTVNLWHGVAWKMINFDATGHTGLLADAHHGLLAKLDGAEFFLTTSPDMDKIMESAFHTKKSKLIEAGYPRNSVFHDSNELARCRSQVRTLLNLPSETMLIAYMPTFRDRTSEVFSFEEMRTNKRLICALERHNAIIVEKPHFVSTQRSEKTETEGDRIFLLSNISATDLMAASDMLVTDYSSCFFDYLLLDKPIVHFIYDYEYYVNDDRGVYYTKEEVACGTCAETVDELLESIEAYLDNPELDHQLREERCSRFWAYDSSDSCERIYQAIREMQRRQGMKI